MKVTVVSRCCFSLSFLVLLVLTSCASDTSHLEEQQGTPNMNRGKGMGMGMGHGRKGGPPGVDRNDSDAEPDLPVEAFVACEGKSSGDIVEFSKPDGKVVRATCVVIDEHLVAVPVRESGNNNRE